MVVYLIDIFEQQLGSTFVCTFVLCVIVLLYVK